MLTTISRVITAVVACASSVGGSPISATRRTPPFFAAATCASPSEAASHAAVVSNASTPRTRGARCMMGLLWGSARVRYHARMNRPLVIHGAAIVTADDADTIHTDAALVVDNDRI